MIIFLILWGKTTVKAGSYGKTMKMMEYCDVCRKKTTVNNSIIGTSSTPLAPTFNCFFPNSHQFLILIQRLALFFPVFWQKKPWFEKPFPVGAGRCPVRLMTGL
ncbi:MAG: hypothetical protein LBC52_01270 [Treponema sp.]|jgi:hypothetical protein|nr:hypothetical protein [Treponema sp.]